MLTALYIVIYLVFNTNTITGKQFFVFIAETTDLAAGRSC